MIRKLTIENFKSIERLEVELGRVNVLIGENGSGKSNILEAIAFASAAAQDKLGNEFLTSRGIRVTEPRFMRAAFTKETATAPIHIALDGEGKERVEWHLRHSEKRGGWNNLVPLGMNVAELLSKLEEVRDLVRQTQPPPDKVPVVFVSPKGVEMRWEAKPAAGDASSDPDVRFLSDLPRGRHFYGFLIYSPENTALRTFQSEGQILPLGIKGEGLFAHLKTMATDASRDHIAAITEKLRLIDWFDRFDIPADLGPGEYRLSIGDRYLEDGLFFDQRSANEGFLFLLFYFTLFISPDTPAFFAIDNVDASLNPKLCSALVRELVDLAKTHDKQTILTTHNPAILDGLDLHDDEQRLFVVHRNSAGHTKVRRIAPMKPLEGDLPIRLSEAFLQGYLGGLPENF